MNGTETENSEQQKGAEMQHHRFLKQLAGERRVEAAAANATGFMMCPLALMPGWPAQPCPWQEVYRLLFEKAQPPAPPSWQERLQADLMN
jgi:hypothetical protein